MSRTTRLALVTLLGVILAAATITPTASAAAQRYASPTGTGTDCTAAKPCSIINAVENASTGDEVIVKPGDYPLTETLFPPAQTTIHGVAGQPRPRLLFGPQGQREVYLQHGATLRYVEVHQAAAMRALYASASTVDQVIATGTEPGWQTAEIDGGTISNSIVVASGTNARAIQTSAYGFSSNSSSAYRNVTAIATGSGGVAIEAEASTTATATAQLVNVIARSPSGLSLLASTDSSGAQAKITYTHTNYGSADHVGSQTQLVSGGSNPQEDPAFVNAAAGDFRQAPGAYTIDAGLDDPINGAVDADGDPRRIGTTDIGADEFVVAPVAATGTAGAVTGQSATLTGSVNANGAPTTYQFQYGPTSAHGSTTPATAAGSGTGAVATGATLGGLSPATTYHYRIVATNAGGVTHGADRIFTTAASPSPDDPTAEDQTSTPPTPTPGFAGVKVSTRLAFARRFITLRLTCPAATVGRCSGGTKLTARRRRTSSRAGSRVMLGRASFSIAAGARATVRVRVSRAGRRRLSGVRRLRGRVRNAATSGAGESKTTMARVTIRRRHR